MASRLGELYLEGGLRTTCGSNFTMHSMDIINSIGGRYEGVGAWYDSTGKTMTYTDAQENHVTQDGFEFQFKHQFEDGTATDAHFKMDATTM